MCTGGGNPNKTNRMFLKCAVIHKNVCWCPLKSRNEWKKTTKPRKPAGFLGRTPRQRELAEVMTVR